MKKRNASGTPFHCFDIPIPNHSPPTDMNATCHVRKPSVRPAIAVFLGRAECRFVGAARAATGPRRSGTAVAVSIATMPI